MSPADRKLARVMKLLAVARDLHEKQGAVWDEIDEILADRPGIGEKMKALEKAFGEAWGKRYAKGDAKAYIFNYKEDAGHLKKIVQRIGVEEACRRAVRFVLSNHQFYVDARHPFRLFVRDVNQLAGTGELTFVDDDDIASELQKTAERRRALHS